MDKNTIIGFSLIAVLIVGFMQLSKKSDSQLAAEKRLDDSIELVSTQQKAIQELSQTSNNITENKDTETDSIDINSKFGPFSVAATGTQNFFTLENQYIKLLLSNKGGRIYSAELKNYRTHDSLPLILFEGSESHMGFTLTTNNNRVLNTNDLFFEALPVVTDKNGNQSLTLRLKTNTNGYLDIVYTLPANNYMLQIALQGSNLNTVMPAGANYLEMQWASKIRQQERGRTFENRYSQIEYKFTADDVEKMSESKADAKQLPNKVKWIAFKDQFFSSILIAEDSFTATRLKSDPENENSKYLKSYSSDMTVAFDPSGKMPTKFKMYLGPNQYKILSAYDKELDGDSKLKLNKLIPLGWGIFGWVNRFAIIPMFNLFSQFISNFGLVILLMTVVIKLVLSPLTYKSYISSAKMRVLKPEIDEINAKIPAEKAAERQRATMDLYNKVGVSPFSGCLPSLLQMPILFALFSFFPAAIELRQESFLWAHDLSSYDSIATLPFSIPFGYGNHVSLFTLLMTIISIVYTKLNMSNTATPDQPGAGLMKWMMYLMPVIFMFMFNGYASGLSYYYFIATLFSVIQTYLIRATVDEKKLLAQLHAKRAVNAKKPVKKNGFMERLEKMQREQEKLAKTRATQKKR